jgi:nucleotide-binding universal stress UspA family protein
MLFSKSQRMEPHRGTYFSALQDFNSARRKAAIQDILAWLTGRSSELLSYDEVAEKLKLNVRTESGVHEIPLKAIIGSVGRYTEFTRDFMPRKKVDQHRWARIKAAVDEPGGAGLPPVEVYKVGEAYFVLDGHHRISVAREEGNEFISARVIEVKTTIPISADLQPDELIIKSEYADFLEKTDFASLRPGADLTVTVPGQYEKLLEHIQIHRYFMGIDFQRDISYPEAVGHWYDVVYSSIVEPMRERGLLHWFPGRTETDLYLWVSAYRAELENELGWPVRPEAVAEKLAVEENPNSNLSDTGSWRTGKMIDRYTDRLFGEILVPITGMEESWQALEQAILVGQKEESTLQGLHVMDSQAKVDENQIRDIQERFNQRCQEANLTGSLVVEEGNVSRQVSKLALLADLIVLNVAHPPPAGLPSMRSGLRSIIWDAARPILTVPGKTSLMDNALLAFDGSPKSKEALFVATYLAEKWHAKLAILTIADENAWSVQDYARTYLELHDIQAEFIVKSGSFDIFLDEIKERQVNLVVTGSYSGNAIKEVIAGSAVNFLLRDADCPLLICK